MIQYFIFWNIYMYNFHCQLEKNRMTFLSFKPALLGVAALLLLISLCFSITTASPLLAWTGILEKSIYCWVFIETDLTSWGRWVGWYISRKSFSNAFVIALLIFNALCVLKVCIFFWKKAFVNTNKASFFNIHILSARLNWQKC